MSKVKTNWVRKLVFSITFIYLMLTKYILLQYLSKMRFVFSYSFFPEIWQIISCDFDDTSFWIYYLLLSTELYFVIFLHRSLSYIISKIAQIFKQDPYFFFSFFLFAYLPSVLSQRCKVHWNTIKFRRRQSIAFDSAFVRFWRSPHYWHVFYLYDSFIYVFILIEFLTLP